MIKVLLADDQILFRSTLEESLKSDPDIFVCASVSNGDEAVEAAVKHKPDLAVLDIKMPLKSGVEALAEIKAALPGTKVIMLTTFEDRSSIIDAYKLKADGYLLKNIRSDILKMALKCIHQDLSVCDIFVQEIISEYLAENQSKVNAARHAFGDVVLNDTDIEIIKRIAEGKTNKEIASVLNFTEGTVKNRITNILNLTGLQDRTKIAIFAIKNNII